MLFTAYKQSKSGQCPRTVPTVGSIELLSQGEESRNSGVQGQYKLYLKHESQRSETVTSKSQRKQNRIL